MIIPNHPTYFDKLNMTSRAVSLSLSKTLRLASKNI